MTFRLTVLGFAALATISCDAATEMAGDAIGAEVRTQFIAQCESVAENTGVPADRITAGCECSADEFAAEAKSGEIEINRDKVQSILMTCLQDQTGPQSDVPAEAPNG